jgi:hypothetical protein
VCVRVHACVRACSKRTEHSKGLPKICETRNKEIHSWKDVSYNISFNSVQYVEFDIKCAIIFVIYEFPAGTCCGQ